MDWLDFISQMTNALAWPTVTGGAIILLRKQIGSAAERLVGRIGDIHHLKAPGIDVEFERSVKELAQEADQLQGQLTANHRGVDKPHFDEEEAFAARNARFRKHVDIAAVDPRSAVVSAFTDMEIAVRRRFKELYPEERDTQTFAHMIGVLRRDGKITDQAANLITRLSELRNQAAHAQDTAIDFEGALAYWNAILDVYGYLELTEFFGGDGPPW